MMPEPAAEGMNEGTVEVAFVLPLLQRLGYALTDIDAKVPVVFQEGRLGRRPEADFVVYAGPVHDRNSSLLVVEAKPTWETLEQARAQAESYALNLRAPLVLLANGKRIQLWQLQVALETELLFDATAEELTTREGELDLLLSREAVVAYVSTLAHKNILRLSSDFGAYESAELRRLGSHYRELDRTLREGRDIEVLSSTLGTEYPHGAVITASSGMGKTTLSSSLHYNFLRERLSAGAGPLSVCIPLGDVPKKQSLFDYVWERIVPHKPGFSAAALRSKMRESGLVLICDGFDEVDEARRKNLQTELRNLSRDYPLLTIFALSRAGSAPTLDLAKLTLSPLSGDQKWALIDELRSNRADWENAPTYLWDIASNPLLLTLFVRYQNRHGRLPDRLGDVFRPWLERVLRVSERKPSEVALLERALFVLAAASSIARLTITQVIEVLDQADLPAALLDELIANEAVSVEGGQLRFAHEAIADFLRANHIVSLPESEAIGFIQGATIDRESLFPVIAMSIFSSNALVDAMWKRLTVIGLPTYSNALRYRAELSARQAAEPIQPEAFFEQLRLGLEQPLRAFFPHLQNSIRRELTAGEAASDTAIRGQLSQNRNGVMYTYLARTEHQSSVILGAPTRDEGARGRLLKSINLDAARLLGLEDLWNALENAIVSRELVGSSLWANERLYGRIRFLVGEHGFHFDAKESLHELRSRLEPHRQGWVSSGRGFGTEGWFSVESMIHDLDALAQAGYEYLDAWAPVAVAEPSREELAKLLHEHFSREQLIYRELVEAGFNAVSGDLGFYPMLPIRWTVSVSNLGGLNDRWKILCSWLPVADWAEAGVDVRFTESLEMIDVGQHFRDVNSALYQLGRYVKSPAVWVRSSLIPDFGGSSSGATEMYGETSALIAACKMLREELKALFEAAD